MCGIVGASLSGDRAALEASLDAAAAALRHRGPDAGGRWTDPNGRVGLAHRRLSIIDLSPEGNQPMRSPGGRFVICFNGEIYNYRELRAELDRDGVRWRGHSDTEVAVAAIETWGLEAALGRFAGMFAFALFDTTDGAVTLVRDRLGVKPLYYAVHGPQWAFASELKALRHFDFIDRDVDLEALSLYLRYGYVPAPLSIYRGARKLEPGTMLRLPADGGPPQHARYWDLVEVARAGAANPWSGSDAEAVDELARRLDESIRLRMVADVPVGAFLSGGIDSSTVVALMRGHSPHRVKTFTIGFDDAKSNEAEHAAAIARHLDTEHHELYIGEPELLRHVDDITAIGDEPFADPSILPTWIVSRLAAGHVKVVASGDGGDEFFCGYGHYARADEQLRLNRRLPPPLSRWAGELMCRASGSGGKLARRGAVLAAADHEDIARAVASHWQRPARILRGGTDADRWIHPPDPRAAATLRDWMMLRDGLRYLPDDILHKVDRASMAASLEAREPLLDHRVVEFAARLPAALKTRDGQSKWPLRQVLERHVPRALFDRPKQGFGVPVSRWLRGELRTWARDLLADPALDEFFDADALREVWDRRVERRGGTRGGTRLWDVLVFVNWLRQDRAVR